MRNPLILLGIILLLAFCIRVITNNISGRTATKSAKIITGNTIKLADKTISSSGGQIVVDDPRDPLNGLTIDVPANAYNDDRHFNISYSDIKSFDCGPYFHPITPLITISNGGGNSGSSMTITIPVRVPPGQFAMAFLYNHKTGELEGMPFSETGEDYIKVVTTNFSNTEPNEISGFAAQLNGATDVPLSEIAVSIIDTPTLMKDYVTPFEPGTDDWQFVNWGSYIAPGGHCSGQVMGMLWYYHNKKRKGSPSLFGRFDNDGINKTPVLWQDDVAGYKFCSMLQLDWSYSDANTKITAWQNNDTRTMWAFAYAMRITDEPQLCIIGTWKDDSRHAILVYGMKGGKLLVNDPNKPGTDKPHIYYDPYSKTFTPYFTGLKAGDPGMQWPRIYYYAKSMVKSWQTAAIHWQEVASKTIGDDKFPNYTIVALNERDEFVPLADGFNVPLGGTLTLRIRCPGVETDYQVYDANGFPMKRDGDVVTLPEADQQLIGVCVTDTAKSKHWIGFKWFKVKVASTNPVIEEPMTGKIRLEMRIDGRPVPIDSANFSTDLGITIRGWGPRLQEGTYAFPYTVTVHARNWHGIGSYDLDNGGEGTYLWQYHSYYPDPKQPGTLRIETWRNGNLDGKFYFDVIDNQGNKKFVDGEFHR